MGIFSSFESKTIKIAMNALAETTNMVPQNSTEYFPSQPEMKATLKANFFPEQMKASLKRDYGVAKPENAAYHLLDIVGHLFDQNSKPDMAGWCFHASIHLDKQMS